MEILTTRFLSKFSQAAVPEALQANFLGQTASPYSYFLDICQNNTLCQPLDRFLLRMASFLGKLGLIFLQA